MNETPLNRKKLVIFDDDEDLLSICSYFLEQSGWQVSTFTDCTQIIERVSEIAPDVILMDNWIPEEGGITATRALKASDQLKHIPVVYFSANSDIEKLCAEAGADGYLAKPFDLDELVAILEAKTTTTVK
jgi:DNA-binding response OmpR family regulator